MKSLQERLSGLDTILGARIGGRAVSLQPIPGETPVIQVVIDGREELPIFVTASGGQTLCICYLWKEEEVIPEQRAELMGLLLDLNPSIPLSSFGRVGGHYVLFGALANHAGADDIATDIAALSDNALDALESLSGYLL